jgi:hypothetical protein
MSRRCSTWQRCPRRKGQKQQKDRKEGSLGERREMKIMCGETGNVAGKEVICGA